MKFVLSIAALTLLDQLTKLLSRTFLAEPVEVFSWFSLTFVENTGIAFSLPIPQFILVPVIVIVLLGIGWMLFKQKHSHFENISLVLIFAGALGNLIDRVLYGAVTDMFAFWNFPIFNVADSLITIGVVILILEELRRYFHCK